MANSTITRKRGKYTIESTIPKFAAQSLNIQAGDSLEWDMDMVKGEKVLIVRKMDKSGRGV